MNRHFVFALLLAVSASSACSSGDDTGTSGGGSGGGATMSNPATGAGSGGSGTAAGNGGGAGSSSAEEFSCVNQDEINYDCSFNLPPIMGSCAPAGTCCHRASNIAKLAALGPDDPMEFEYRLNFVDIYNHPLSIGLPDLTRTAAQRAEMCAGEQCLLWRFTAPRSGGEFVPGAGEAEIGIGMYNCDGTFSFYGPDAASDRSAEIGESAKGRWQAVKVPAEYDPAKEGIERFHIPWATNKNREIARSLFLFPMDNSLDWELASSGFEITTLDTSEAGQDCMGSRPNMFSWNTVNGFVSYSPLKGNDKDISNQINQTYCSLLAFGLLPDGMKEKDCLTTERCMPDAGNFGDGGCDWIKLPDSLCPETEEDRAIFGCHLGAEGNPNAEPEYPASLNCSQEEPTEALDPDMGETSVGQCCDPLGQSTTLPACNAYRTLGKFVAAASEITTDPRNKLPLVCM